MPNYLRAYAVRSEGSKPGEPIRFIASTEGIKRDGKALKAADWQLEHYRANPVFLWVHDYMGSHLPIGRTEANIDGQQLVADASFDQEDEFARQVESKYRRGYLNAVSVGWDDVANCPNCGARLLWFWPGMNETYRLKCKECGREIPKDVTVKHELLDISGVPVPGDPDALMERQYARLRALYDDNPPELESVGLQWDEAAVLMLRALDPASPMTDRERRTAYNRAERFYRLAGKRAPELLPGAALAALGPAELTGLFLEDEPALFPTFFATERVGAVLSARNRGDLEQAITLVQGVLDRAKPEDQPAAGDGQEAARLEQSRAFLARLDSLFPLKGA